jgi:hypothetical protein
VSHLAGARGDGSVGLQGDPQRAVHHKRNERGEAHQDRVPIQNARVLAGPEIRPQREEEFAGSVQGNAPDHVAQRRPEKDHQQRTGAGEHNVPERLPHEAFEVVAELDGDAAQDQQPEHHHQGQVKPAETRGIESREGKIERPTPGQQPDFVAVPDRSDGLQNPAALRLGASNDQVNDSGAQVKAVQDNIHGDHDGNQTEPDIFHNKNLRR